MATVQKLPSGSWRGIGRIRRDGKMQHKSFTVSPSMYGGDSRRARREALFLAEEWERDGAAEEYEGISVRDALDKYIGSRERVLSPSTVVGYEKAKRQLLPFVELMDKSVLSVSSSDIQPIINTWAVDLSAKTIKNRISFLLSVLEYSGNDRRIKLTYPKRRKPEVRTPDSQDIRRLLDNSSGELKISICLAAFGTLRRGEICALLQSDILRDLSSVSVTKDMVDSKDGGYVVKDIPKTVDSYRVVKFPREVIRMIPVSDPDEPVIHLTPTAVSMRFSHLAKKVGVECSFHDLRHYAASFRSDLGIPAKYIEEAGGWSAGGASVLKSVYDNPLKENRRKYTDMTNRYIEETFGDLMTGT